MRVPTIASNAPGSRTSRSSRPTKLSSRAASEKLTVREAPGSSAIFSNRRSRLTGGVTDATTSRTYSSTLSLPARLPVLVTVTETRTESRGPTVGVATRRLEYANDV